MIPLVLLHFIVFVIGSACSQDPLVGLHQDDARLIKAIKNKYLNFPKQGSPYNFTKTPDIEGQWGQALAIEKLFKDKKNGFFIEAGAFDGEHFANTLLFEMKHDWTGLLVEPNPDNYEKLKTKNRRAIITETCFSTEKEVVSVEFDAAGAVGGIINGHRKPGEENSNWVEHIKRTNKNHVFKHPYDRRTLKLECLPLTSIIMALGNPTIDYLSLDIEGAEFQVLKTIDFERVDIKVISLENRMIGNIFEGSGTEIRYFLSRNGYKKVTTVGQDDIYAQTEFLRQMDEL